MNIQFLKRSLMLLLILLGLSWQSFSQFRVIGYLPSWAGNVSDIQFSKLTHVNYAFLIPNSDGSVQTIDNATKMQSLVSAAHAAGVKVEVSVGGWGGGDGFHGIVASAANRTNFVNTMLSYCSRYGLDGVDIDWEYPGGGTEANNFVTLMQQLSTALHGQGKILSAAVIAYDGSSILSGVFAAVDYMGIMAYDENNFQHSTYDLAVQSMNYWLGRGLPKAKAVLGVPFYAQPNSVGYNTLLAQGADPYADVFNGEGYNGITTIQKKTTLAMNQGGGIMAWDLSTDAKGTYSLVTAIDQIVKGGTTPPPSTTAPIGKTIWLQGNTGQYVSSKNGVGPMYCNAAAVQGWNQFLVGDAGNGRITLQNLGRYVTSNNGDSAMACNRAVADDWEEFTWIANADGTISLKGNNGLFVSSNNGTSPMACDRPAAQGWEDFHFGIVTGTAGAAANAVSGAGNSFADLTPEAGVYPNPVKAGQLVTVNLKRVDGTSPILVSIADLSGKIVAVQSIKQTTGVFTLATGGLNKGVYLVKIVNGRNVTTQKVLIQ
ncbi:MAG: T9SS type A sorting domain-containing protein [Bacteroidetes bacterium]|nr:T9SS type A sorting domain-containing protein [Bacteroidota bacterium]